ncbi:MAG: thioredoxin family protein [Elusimicrobia bacterium]|nr:thioredoxin family protein [Elusimicrobiota bacterium]
MRHALCALLLACAPAAASDVWLSDLAAAKKAAAASGKPILVDFQAVWCYSCYFMEQKVLSKDPFKAAAKGLVLVKLDVDTEEGLALKKKLRAGFLPSYVLMDASERELGRIVGEQNEGDFLAQLARLLGPSVLDPAARLTAALDANDLDGATRVRREARGAKVPPSGPAWEKASARLDLASALKRGERAGAVAAFRALMRLGGGCELPYHLFRASDSLDAAAETERREALEAARGPLAGLAESRFFGPPEERCADARSVLEAPLSVYKRLGLKSEETALLERVLAELGKRLKSAGVGEDRNLDDNYRFFLAQAGRKEELRAHLERLVAAYPNDYVYSYRLAGVLKEAGRTADALASSRTAYNLSYGANRSAVARLRAELLAAGGAAEEARALLRLELKAAKGRFPDEAKALEALLKKLGG